MWILDLKKCGASWTSGISKAFAPGHMGTLIFCVILLAHVFQMDSQIAHPQLSIADIRLK